MMACAVLGIHHAFTSRNSPEGNADTERMVRALKRELVWLREWRDPYELSAAMETWMETYNATWLHSALDYRTSNRMEETFYLTTRTLIETAG